jgi:L-asparaginase / beta-aspartyl-peptidase
MHISGDDIQAAADHLMQEVSDLGDRRGIIAAVPNGTAKWVFSAPGTYRGKSTSTGERIVAIDRNGNEASTA